MTLARQTLAVFGLIGSLFLSPRAKAEENFFFNRRGEPVYLRQVPSPIGARTFSHVRAVRYQNGPPLLVTGTVGVQFLRTVSRAKQNQLLEKAGLFVERTYVQDPAFVVARVNAGVDPFQAAQTLFWSGLTEWAEPTLAEPIRIHAVEPNDPVYALGVQLHLRQDLHGFPEAWEITTGSPEVVVAIIDTGIDVDHPELAGNTIAGYDVFDPGGDGSPVEDFEDDYHGTAVAGLIGAATSNGEGIAGICWDCTLLGIRLIDRKSTIYADRSLIYDAFRTAIDQGAWIINNSWGPVSRNENNECVETPFSEFVAKGVEEAEQDGRGGLGTLVLWSAGNDSCPTDLQPHLAHDLTVVVSALDGFGGFQSAFSNYGPHVSTSAVEGNFTTDITGQGGASDGSDPYLNKIEGLNPADYMRNFRGTSASVPIVTGALALALAANPGLSAAELRSCLASTATRVDDACPHGEWSDAGVSPCYGHGRLQAEALVQLASSGHCGGVCIIDEDCPENTSCDPLRGICVFNSSDDTEPGKDTDHGSLDTESDPSNSQDAGLSGGDDVRDSGLERDNNVSCGCRTVGV